MLQHYEKNTISLHKTSFASAISSKLDCIRLALSLHKTSFASAISSKFDCVRLALSLSIFMEKTLFISFLTLLCHNIRAQISGVVVDIETRRPIRDVMINMNNNRGVKTSWNGSFSINDDFSSATFTRPGYLSRNMNREEIKDTVFLLPNGRTLAEVVVYAKKPGPKFNYSGMTATDRKLLANQGMAKGFNILGFIPLAINALKDKHKMSKKEKLKQQLDNY